MNSSMSPGSASPCCTQSETLHRRHALRRYARRWNKERGQFTAAAYVPLSFAPGEAYQFGWSHEMALLSGADLPLGATQKPDE
jgi:hypothetical protein